MLFRLTHSQFEGNPPASAFCMCNWNSTQYTTFPRFQGKKKFSGHYPFLMALVQRKPVVIDEGNEILILVQITTNREIRKINGTC